MAELFETTVANINIHLKAIYEENELDAGATIKSYLIVRTEGTREVSRTIQHYALSAILAVGYRVRSHRGTHPDPLPMGEGDLGATAAAEQCQGGEAHHHQ